MRYDIEKLIDILVILAKGSQELTKLRINKLLYFIDKYHLWKYGRFVLNDKYYRLPLGPIPSRTFNLIDNFFEPRIVFRGRKIDKNPLEEYFEASKNRSGYDTLKLKKEVNFGSLSDSEIEIIDYVLKTYGRQSTGQLVNISHRERTWRDTVQPNEIDYELFLDGMPEDKKEMIKVLMKSDAESDFLNYCLNK